MTQHQCQNQSKVTVESVRGAVYAANEAVALACGMELLHHDIGITRQNGDLIVIMRFRGETPRRPKPAQAPELASKTSAVRRSRGRGLLAFFPTLDTDMAQKEHAERNART